MKIRIQGNYGCLIDWPADVYESADAEFTVWSKNSFFAQRRCRWAKVEPIHIIQDARIPFGLIPKLLEKFPCEVEDPRTKPICKELPSKPGALGLYPHQQQAVDWIITEPRGTIDASTGSGKTFMMAEVVRRLGVPTLYLTDQTSALIQTWEKLRKQIKAEVGIAGGGKCEDPFADIVVTTPESVHKTNTERALAVILDEAHHVPAKTYQKLLEACPNAYFWYGCTGTLTGRSDGLEIFSTAALGPRVYEVPQEEIAKKWPPCKFMFIECPVSPIPEMYIRDEDLEACTVRGIIRNELRNTLIVSLANCFASPDKGILIYVERIEHGQALAQAIGGEFVWRETKLKRRQEILSNFKGKKIVATDVFSEAVDTPDIDVIINAGAARSSIALRQLIGRGLRNKPGKILYYFDFWDEGFNMFESRSQTRFRICKRYGSVERVPHTQFV